MGKYGHDKEGVTGRPLIQIGLATTQQTGIPIFHKVYDGNIHDARILQDMITNFYNYGIKDGLIVFDRGITSAKNQKDIFDLKWKVLCGLPIKGDLQKYLENVIIKEDIRKYENRVKLNKNIFYVQTQNYTLNGIKGTLAICFNERQSRELRESRYDEIAEAEKLIKAGKSIKPEMKDFFDNKNKLVRLRLKKAELLDGYSCIFTTEQLSDEMIVKMYFDKDIVEKAFQSMKGIIRVQPIRHWLYNRVIAHIFICYLAYLLLTLLKIRLAPLAISPMEALTELASLYKVYLRDKIKGFQLSRTVVLTKNQENIIKTIDKTLLTKCSV
jgi:transposase